MPIGNGARVFLAAEAAGVLICAGAGAAPVAYDRLAKAQAVFEAIPAAQRDKVVFRVVVVHADAADTSPIRMTVTFRGKTEAFGTPVKNGVVLPPLRADMIAGHAVVETGQRADSLRESIGFTLAVPSMQPIPVRYLLDAAQQAQGVMRAGARQMAGMFAVFVTPKVHGVVAELARCCGEVAVLQANDRRQSFTQGKTGKVVLPLSVLEDFDGGVLKASAPVVVLDPDTD